MPVYSTIDAQVALKLPKPGSTLKVGGSNIFNKCYIQFAAGPSIGALYDIAATIDITHGKQ